MSTNIYLKEADQRNIPSSWNHILLPILFAEWGDMPNSKSKPKRCCVVVTVAGITFFRPRPMIHFKESLFIPTYDIKSIVWESPKRRFVVSRDRSLFFQVDHADQAVGWIIAAHLSLVPEVKLSLESFPGAVGPAAIDLVAAADLAHVRYAALCQQYGGTASEPVGDV
jgi:hypothetical protein